VVPLAAPLASKGGSLPDDNVEVAEESIIKDSMSINSTRKTEWARFNRLCKNADRMPVELGGLIHSRASKLQLFQDWFSCGENIKQLTTLLQRRVAMSSSQAVVWVWWTRSQIVAQHGECHADALIAHKSANNMRKPHPEFPNNDATAFELCCCWCCVVLQTYAPQENNKVGERTHHTYIETVAGVAYTEMMPHNWNTHPPPQPRSCVLLRAPGRHTMPPALLKSSIIDKQCSEQASCDSATSNTKNTYHAIHSTLPSPQIEKHDTKHEHPSDTSVTSSKIWKHFHPTSTKCNANVLIKHPALPTSPKTNIDDCKAASFIGVSLPVPSIPACTIFDCYIDHCYRQK
jgi:hypothetical protein